MIIGAGVYTGVYAGATSSGFLGNIGEIRICSERLTAENWLTARRS